MIHVGQGGLANIADTCLDALSLVHALSSQIVCVTVKRTLLRALGVTRHRGAAVYCSLHESQQMTLHHCSPLAHVSCILTCAALVGRQA